MIRSLTLALCLSAAACAPAESAGPPVWRLERGETTIYLFGSAHALTPDAEWRSRALDAALADAEQVLFEIAPGAALSQETQDLFTALGRNPPGMTLSAQLTSEDAARLDQIAERLNLSRDALETLRPWAAAQQIALATALAQGVRPELGVEAVLTQALDGRPAAGLETPEQQLQVLAALSPDRERRLLSLTLAQAETDPTEVLEAEAAWIRGDSEAIAALTRTGFLGLDQAFYDAMITERNRAFAAAAAERLTGADEDVLIVIGAAHLSGPDGVIAMLRDQGYAVEGP
jgi:uncharacterized protein YbaP (TraB family)